MAQMVKNLPAMHEIWVWSLGQEDPPRERFWLPTPVFLSAESHGQRSLVSYGPWYRRVRHDWETNIHSARKYLIALVKNSALFVSEDIFYEWSNLKTIINSILSMLLTPNGTGLSGNIGQSFVIFRSESINKYCPGQLFCKVSSNYTEPDFSSNLREIRCTCSP